MSKRRFTIEQIQELLKNSNVKRCSEKSITYSKEFKIRAIKQYKEDGLSRKEIFKLAGFNLDLIGKNTPDRCIHIWQKTFDNKGPEELLKETRGRGKFGKGPQNFKGSEKEKLKYLEHKVAYLEEENRFLKELRKQKGILN